MNSLTREPLSTILSKLFSEASVTQALFRKEAEKFTPQERAEWMTSTTNYRALYTAAKDFHLAVSRETATLLYMLARAIGARSLIEFGTSFGVSTLHLAAAVRDNGGGRIIST
jgi:predicted O-methyltransferase YrrM